MVKKAKISIFNALNINDLTKLWNSKKLESLVIDFINNFRNVVIEIDQKIEQIVSQKEISYDIDIIKAKIDNIDNEINKDMYQVNIDLGNNGQGVIEIHLKSPLEMIYAD